MAEVTFGPGLGFAYWNGSYNEEMSTTTAAILGWIPTITSTATAAKAVSGWPRMASNNYSTGNIYMKSKNHYIDYNSTST